MSALTSPYRSALPSIFQNSSSDQQRLSKSVTSWQSMTSPSRFLSSRSVYHPDTGAPTGPSREGFNDYVLLFQRTKGSAIVHYLMVDPRHRGRLLPKSYKVTLNKVKDIEDYRVVTLANLLYVTGGRCVGSSYILSYTCR